MSFEYELIISCALAALVILHIIDTHRRWLRLRQQLRSGPKPAGGSHAPPVTRQTGTHSAEDLRDHARWRLHDRLIVLLLILALLWFAGRIWLEG